MKKIFSYKRDLGPLLKLSIPLIAVSIVQSGTGFFETLFLAHLSPAVLAAGALVSWLFGVIIVVIFGTLSSINILIAHQHGAKETHLISSVLRDGFVVAGLLFIPTFLIIWFMPPIFTLLGQPPFVVLQASAYLHPLAWALFPTLMNLVLLEFLLGLGKTKIVMFFTLLSTPLIIVCSYGLIFGKWGLPALHIAGAGWGIMVGNAISAISLLAYILYAKQYKQYWKTGFSFKSPSFILELVRVGFPVGIMYCTEVAFFLAVMLLIGRLGTDVLAASQIVFQYFGPCMGIAFSLAQAITIRMSHELGADNIDSAQRAGYAGTVLILLIMFVAALTYWCIPHHLISVDFNLTSVEHKKIAQLATGFFAIAAIYQLFEAARICIFGALRSYKDTNYTLVTSLISFWGIALPVGYFLSFHAGFNGTGFWWGMVMGGAVGVLLLLYRLHTKNSEALQAAKAK
jgi:MATE family multidrug resistance protein